MNPGFPPKPGGPWGDPRYAGGAYLDWKRGEEERERREQKKAQPVAPPAAGQPADRFSQVEAEAAWLRQEWAAGRLTDDQFVKRMSEIMVQDAQGTWWALGAETGEWYRHDGRKWVRADPPRMATAAQPIASGLAGLTVNPSSVVYLFGHRFVGEAALLSGASLQGQRVAVPCQSAKVDWTKWRDAVFASAFVSLAATGHARLTRGTRSGMLGIRRHETVLVELLTGAGSLSGLEGTILAYASQAPGPRSVYDIVNRLRNGDSFLPVVKELVARGYFMEKGKLAQLVGEKWTPNCQRIRALDGQVQPVKDMIQSFRKANSDVYDLLMKEIEATYR